MIDETKIMQLADGTLPMKERAEVEAAIKKAVSYTHLTLPTKA